MAFNCLNDFDENNIPNNINIIIFPHSMKFRFWILLGEKRIGEAAGPTVLAASSTPTMTRDGEASSSAQHKQWQGMEASNSAEAPTITRDGGL